MHHNKHFRDFLSIDNPPQFFVDRARALLDKFDTEATVDERKVVRWKSNNAIPPKDILEFWSLMGCDFDYNLSLSIGEEETQLFLKEYVESMKNYKHSEEELHEMRNVFGEGATVVNAITGKRTKL